MCVCERERERERDKYFRFLFQRCKSRGVGDQRRSVSLQEQELLPVENEETAKDEVKEKAASTRTSESLNISQSTSLNETSVL